MLTSLQQTRDDDDDDDGDDDDDDDDEDLRLKPNYKQIIRKKKKDRINPEWKKARSRLAARSRREKESQLFREISALLPLDPSEESQLDKASVIRVTIAYLHLRSLLDAPASTTEPLQPGVSSREKWILDGALRGFLLVMSLSGKIIITTQDVVTYIGINQMNLIGRSLFDFMHPCDHKEIQEILTGLRKTQGQHKCEVLLRIKGAVKNMTTPWRVFHCTGVKKSSSVPGSSYLLLLCRSLPEQEVHEIDAHQNIRTFLSVHGPDMKFIYCHSGVLELTGFTDIELNGQSVYQFCHPSDCQHILKSHRCLLSKGQVHTGKYRLLQKGGGYVWVETDATVVHNIRTGTADSIVCINYILSGVGLPDVVISLKQTKQLLNTPNPSTDEQTAQDEKRRRGVNKQTDVCNNMDHLDLDSLAPYIPMHEEDFLLMPALGGLAELETYRDQFNRPPPFLSSDQTKSHSSVLQPTERSFSASTLSRPIKNTRWNHTTPEVTREEVHKRTTNLNHLHLTDISCKNSDGRSDCSHTAPVPLALKYAKYSWHPLNSFHQNTKDEIKCGSPGLPVLSRWDCEVNAPLGPTSHLLQGTELTKVLDQVTTGEPWCRWSRSV